MQVHAHLRNYPHDVLARNPSFKIIDSCTHSPFTKRWKSIYQNLQEILPWFWGGRFTNV